MTVNHRRRILGTTTGHPGSWNNKTLVLYDTFIRGIKRGEILDDNEFELYEKDANCNTIRDRYMGTWIIVYNGYLSWSTTVPLR